MELRYCTEEMIELGNIEFSSYDCAVGGSENNFEIVQDLSNHSLEPHYYVYCNATEFGGIIDESSPDTGNDSVTYVGRSWQGILENKKLYRKDGIITYTGKITQIVQQIINEYNFGGLFVVELNDQDISVTKTFDNFTDIYTALTSLCHENGYKLVFIFDEDDKVVKLSVKESVDYSKSSEWDINTYDFKATKVHTFVNHFIGLGIDETKGTRIECHLYANEKGEISETQTFFGIYEIVETLQNGSKTLAELKDECTKSFTDLLGKIETLETSFDDGDESSKFDIGDIVGAINPLDGGVISQRISKKILKIQNGIESIEVEVGTNE